MRKYLLLVLAVAMFGNCASLLSQTLYPYAGWTHFHTRRSDGVESIDQYIADAKNRHLGFLIPTDHDPKAAEQAKFAAYCRGASVPGRLIIIPGAEITSLWKAERNTVDASHTLALGYSGDNRIESLQGKYDSQEAILRRLSYLGIFSVSAHPNLIAANTFWRWQRLRFDFRSIVSQRLVNGTEFFNSATTAQENQTFNRYLSQYQKTAFAGCDSHGWIDPNDEERRQKLTWVYASSLTEQAILEGFREGRTYAADKGACLTTATAIPGKTPVQMTGPVRLIFNVAFAGYRCDTITFEVWRDGVIILAVERMIDGENNRYQFGIIQWTPPKGVHQYVIRIPGYLVTSPYTFDIQ